MLNEVIELCRQAGDAILEVYQRTDSLDIHTKADHSPLTAADLAAHRVLASALPPLLDGVPVLSEEGELPDFSARRHWNRYWLVDPLDGTKEFINRNGEFTVNVALIERGEPVLGVVHVPVLGVTYAGEKGKGAVKIANGTRSAIATRRIHQVQQAGQPLAVVASRRHGTDAVDDLLARIRSQLGPIESKSMGSSLKLCLIAEGAADFYPRLAPTCEWDTAAAQAVVEAAGGVVLDAQLKGLRYNQKDSLLNPFFYVIGDRSFGWEALLS
nr:3'(2'),5'-bisphosphate nucleotidase CysQ [Aestuariicella hydrocarbonica]